MKSWFRHTGILTLLLLASQAAAQLPVLDSVCTGAVRHYRVDGETGSTYSWILTPPAGADIIMPSDADTVEIAWAFPAGVYELTCVQHAENGCDADAVYGEVHLFDQPLVNAGPDGMVCVGNYYKLIHASAQDCRSVIWQSNGDGTFNDSTMINATYTPGPEDILAGSVQLKLTGYGVVEDGGCDPSYSDMVLFIVTEIVPQFEPVGPLCQYSVAPLLPDTSLEGITGTWSPSVINTDFLGTFPYTFDPDDPTGCAVDTTIFITITDLIVPTFNPIGPLCINSIPPALPDASLEGITGDWDPSVISTDSAGIFTFTFIPNDSTQCGIETSIDIAVVTEIVPEFEPIGPLCQYIPAPELPDTSLNGIAGTWDPLTIVTDVPGTFGYTFTPYPDQCGVDTTIVIVITEQVIPEFDSIGSLCQYITPPLLPDTSLNGITGIWDPAWINTSTPGIFTYTFIPDDPLQCGVVVSTDIIILPEVTPTFEPIGTLCQYITPPILPDTSLEGLTGTWIPPVINTDLTGTTFFTFTPDTVYPCALPVTISITVVSEIIPEFDPIGPLCQYGVPSALPDTSLNDISGVWDPATINTDVPGTFTYTFTPNDPSQCGAQTTLDITIDTEIIPLFDPIGPLCQYNLAPVLPYTSLNNITGNWNPALISTDVPGIFTYKFIPDDPGQCGTETTMDITIAAELIPEFNLISSLCQYNIAPVLPDTSLNNITGYWNPAVINTDVPGIFTFTFTPDNPEQCGIEIDWQITVVSETIPEFDPVLSICQGSPAPPLPVESLNGITGTWDPPVIITTVPGTFLFTFTPDEGQCALPTNIAVEVEEKVIPVFNQIGPLSQNSTAPLLPFISLNGITGTWDPPFIDTSVPGTYTYAFTPDADQCAYTTDIEITVLFDYLEAITGPGDHCLGDAAVVPLEVDKFIAVAEFQLKLTYNVDKLYCEGYSGTHPQIADHLTGWIDQLAGEITLQWQSDVPVTFTQMETVTNLVFTPKEPGQGQLQWYTGATESYFTNLDGDPIPAEFYAEQLNIYNPPEILLQDSKNVCEGDSIILYGVASYSNPPANYYWTYPDGHISYADPVFGGVTPENEGYYTYYVVDSMGCSDQKTIRLVVSDNPVAAFHGTDTLKVPLGYILEAGTGQAYYLWNTGETSESISIDTTNLYSVEMISNVGCYGKDSVFILIITAENPEECLFIPNAFTPNNDGLNDIFKAISVCRLSFFNMQIYNRWGEKLFESDDISEGWDGKKGNELCPGDVYVYKISYLEEGAPEDALKMIRTGAVVIVE